MEVDIATARYKADVEGVTYYFCCASCKSRFLKQPHDYLTHIRSETEPTLHTVRSEAEPRS
jgi:Cu+-exporting ATPase